MPRKAHGRAVAATRGPSRPAKRKSTKSQYHNALEIAEKEIPTDTKLRQTRLGEIEENSDQGQSRANLDERLSKRQKITNGSDDDENRVAGSDGEGNEWHVGVDEDDEDSDIDSDDAFGKSDEERFADFTFRGSTTETSHKAPQRKRKTSDPREVDLSEGEGASDADKESDDFGEYGVDLATALDMEEEEEEEEVEEEDRQEQPRSRRKGRKQDPQSPSLSGNESLDGEVEGGEDSGEDEEYAQTDEESQLSYSDEYDVGGQSKLRSFVEGLSSAKSRSAAQKTLDLGGTKLTATDLLQYVQDPQQRQTLKILANSEKAEAEYYKGGVPGKLEPPLAKRQQDRIDRVAAYEKSKETLNRWIDTVKQNRRAEHISFPFQDPDALAKLSAKELAPTSQSQPMTALEATIKQIMQESGMASKDGRDAEKEEQAFEELQTKSMPLEELQARRAELRRARDLMFREEIRARRIKKIKSKAYRRVHRKERDREAEHERAYQAATGLIDSDEERERNERRRAETRMGARHRESKWAKSVKATGIAAWDEDARHGMSDLARRDDELRKRIEGKTVRDSDGSGDESSSYSDTDLDSDEDAAFQGFEDKLDALEQDAPSQRKSNLGSMAFMQKAEAARKAANDAQIKQVRRNLRGEQQTDEEEGTTSVGRLKFGTKDKFKPGPALRPADKSEFEERLSEDENEGQKPEPTAPAAIDEHVNGSGNQGKPPASKSPNIVAPSIRYPPSKSEKLMLSKANQETAQGIQMSKPLIAPKIGKEQTLDEVSSESSDSSSDEETERPDQDAIAKALFAGDIEVENDFGKEKKETVVEEGDQVIDNSLPGWGSWTGAGVSKKEQKRAKGRFMTTIKGVAEEKRKDVKLDRVIINEKRVKKNGKYLATELPHPFESRQQYERSLRLPIGPEWTTKSTFQDATKPRVLMKQAIIRPMARPMA